MISKFLVNSYLSPIFPIIALILFFGIFTGMLFFVFQSKNKKKWDSIALLPLEKEIENRRRIS